MSNKTTARDIAKGITGAFLAIITIKAILLICAISVFCIYIACLFGIFMPGILHPSPFPTFKPVTP